MKIFIKLYIIYYLICSHSLFAKINITFINPGHSHSNNSTGGFWSKVTSFMRSAAEDLDIELNVLYAEREHFQLVTLAKKVASSTPRPDYVILVNETGQGPRQLEITNKAGLKTFFILNTLTSSKDLSQFHHPGHQNNHWIGSLIPNNYYAGLEQANQLIKKAKSQQKSSINLIGLGGDFITPASIERNKGLKESVLKNKIKLKQIIQCHWSQEEAYNKTIGCSHFMMGRVLAFYD